MGSYIEDTFRKSWDKLRFKYDLIQQYPILRYYVDFAHVESRFAIELDGHATHSSPKAIAQDRKRQREIEAQGWKIVRFGGLEIVQNPIICAKEERDMLYRHIEHKRKWDSLQGELSIRLSSSLA